jgi:hypothetical protein
MEDVVEAFNNARLLPSLSREIFVKPLVIKDPERL